MNENKGSIVRKKLSRFYNTVFRAAELTCRHFPWIVLRTSQHTPAHRVANTPTRGAIDNAYGLVLHHTRPGPTL